jgi:hypothetical protein
MLGYLREDGTVIPPAIRIWRGLVQHRRRGELHGARRDRDPGAAETFCESRGRNGVAWRWSKRSPTAASPKRAHASTAWKDEARGELIALYTDDPELKREQLMAAARELGLLRSRCHGA